MLTVTPKFSDLKQQSFSFLHFFWGQEFGSGSVCGFGLEYHETVMKMLARAIELLLSEDLVVMCCYIISHLKAQLGF